MRKVVSTQNGGSPTGGEKSFEESFAAYRSFEIERTHGLSIKRLFTREPNGEPLDPYETVTWTRRDVLIRDGEKILFEASGVEAPSSWSGAAVEILASKYLRTVPSLPEGRETSARQVVSRLAATWRHWGEAEGYFRSGEDAKAFEDEVAFMLLHQLAAPNSPQFFNTGLSHAYGVRGAPQGHWYFDAAKGEARETLDAYSRPQVHACIIQPVSDSLQGITELLAKESRLFKFGSGTGTNFSAIRGEGEPLSGGGTSSGLMSFLKVFDAAAGAIKSGGTTRRAAKMVVLDCDHPDIFSFVRWKANEERKAKLLIEHGGYASDFNGEAYQTVSGQNSNNSVRVTDEFMRRVAEGKEWKLVRRTDGATTKRIPARELWKAIADAAWECADPGVQFDTTINEWHTCPESGQVNASNPCSEYLFLDNTACNLASLNLTRFLRVEGKERFDVEAFRHAVKLWTVVLDISNSMASFPAREIAEETHRYRTIGLGFAGLGAMLMRAGIAYDSDRGRAIAGAITALMTGEAYATSAELARELGSYPAFEENREHHLRVVRNHRRAAYGATDFEGLSISPQALDERHAPAYLLRAAREAWDRAIEWGEEAGYRGAHISCIAPTGTIGLLMDCDTTGLEPVFALLATKKLAGGGSMTIAVRSVEPGLRALGYRDADVAAILAHVETKRTLDGAPHLRAEHRAVFATAGELTPEAHLKTMAAVQPFVSGAISKTVNMKRETTPGEIASTYEIAWRLGLKAVAVYRDGSKGAQVLEALRPSEFEPPPCISCGEGVCELPSAVKRKTFEAIAGELRALRFVAYGADKVPIDAKTGRAASVTREETWASFEEALEFVRQHPERAVGPGVILRPEDRVVCLDLDQVLDPVDGLKPFAEELVERFGSYTELSLSKRGLHIFFSVSELPDFPGGKWTWKGSAFEVWHASRYIALTGELWRWDGAGAALEERTEALRRLLSESEPLRVLAPAAGAGERRQVNTQAMLELLSVLGVRAGEDSGRKLLHCFMPRHVDTHASLSVDPERGWYCHGCRSGGGVVRLREVIRELTDEDIEHLSKRMEAPASRILAARERLRREGR